MYLHLGQNVMVRNQDVIGIFDLDTASWSFRTRRFLERAQREGRVTEAGGGLPRSFVLTDGGRVYLTPLSAPTLSARAERGSFE